MPQVKNPRIRTVWLGKALEQIREDAGITAKDAASYLQKDPSTISRMEDGKVPVNEQTLEGYLEMCGITDAHRCNDLRTFRRDAANSGWWDGYQADVAPQLIDRAWIESRSAVINSFDMAYLPGLLQTPDYAREVMGAVDPDAPSSDIERWLEVRLTRQHVISKHKPTKLMAIVDEPLLRRQVGSIETMREQLSYLIEVAAKPHIEIRVLPEHTFFGVSGSFEVLDLCPPYPKVGYVASPAGDICVEGEAVLQLERTYDRLKQASLNKTASKRLIASERNERW